MVLTIALTRLPRAGQRPVKCLRYKVTDKTHQFRKITNVAQLPSWDAIEFRRQAFAPQVPCAFGSSSANLPPACNKWFVEEGPDQTRLKETFWKPYWDIVVPLEITSRPSGSLTAATFERVNAPLGVLLSDIHKVAEAEQTQSVYLAQHNLRDLPVNLQEDLPTPRIVKEAGRGDIYMSSLWLGRAPTYTSLHRDPNPNLFQQLAGTKTVRLCSPEIGQAVSELVQSRLRPDQQTSSRIRGSEMMAGTETSILHNLIWPAELEKTGTILQHFSQAVLTAGEALFIPKGWWHSVKGVGNGVTASANWWFR